MRFRGLLPVVLLVAGFLGGLVFGPSVTTVTHRSVETLTSVVTVTAWEILLRTITATLTLADSDGDGIPDQKEWSTV